MINWFKKKEDSSRELNHPQDLQVKDMITFKPRSIVPPSLQGQTLTVTAVSAYQYDDGLMPEFTLQLPSGERFNAACEKDSDGEWLTLAIELSQDEVLSIFDGEEFGEVFGENFARLVVNPAGSSPRLEGWLAKEYRQSIKEAVGFYYEEDRREKGVSQYVDDAEELRYHECEGSPDDYCLSVEIWEDGSTDVYALVSVPLNVIDEMWPRG